MRSGVVDTANYQHGHVRHSFTAAEVLNTVVPDAMAVAFTIFQHRWWCVRYAIDDFFAIKLLQYESTVRRRAVRTEVEEHESSFRYYASYPSLLV